MFRVARQIGNSFRSVASVTNVLKTNTLICRPLIPINSIHLSRTLFTGHRLFGQSEGQADSKFATVLDEEIRHEKEHFQESSAPKGFEIAKLDGVNITLKRKYADGVHVDIDLNLAGSVGGGGMTDEMDQDNEETPAELHSRPEVIITIAKPSGRFVKFSCSFPDTAIPIKEGEDSTMPTYAVESVEVGNINGYFVYSDLFDDNVFDQLMQLLLDRGLDAEFQDELQAFCTSQELSCYLKFLEELNAYCKE